MTDRQPTPAPAPVRPRVFLTGATGYIGGRLVPRLLEAGYPVRCFVRAAGKLADRPWRADPRVEVVQGDVADAVATAAAMAGCGPAYYLVHSMVAAGREYALRDRELARAFRIAAERARLERIIYLGGLGEEGADLSAHLASRREVESELAAGPVPVTVFRAAMIIGSGSASFEILHYLVEHLPVMVTPSWVKTECQPIAVRNVLGYLVDALESPATLGRTLDIGGPDIVTYRRMMEWMADARGLPRRLVIPLPVLSPRLSSYWIHLVTPISREIARPLAEGLRNRVVCRGDEAQRLLPQPLVGVREAIARALARAESGAVETAWSSAGPIPGDPDWAGGTVFTDERSIDVRADPEGVFGAVCRIGGRHGWYAWQWLWRARGVLDRLAGGPGLRRGRRDAHRISFGEPLDFWRVTGIEPNRRLALRAEMKLPGEALLEFTLAPQAPASDGSPRTRLTQTARFLPRGLLGLAYWHLLLLVHGLVFRGMLDGIRAASEARSPASAVP